MRSSQLATAVLSLVAALACTPCDGAFFTFSGSADGGTASGTMEFLWDDITNVLTVTLHNTSPLLLDDESGPNAPGITGFGFDAEEPIPDILSWTLVALDADDLSVQIDDQGGTGDWQMTGGVQGITLDFFPTTNPGVSGALYNPDQTTGFAGPPIYFTEAILTVEFASTFNLDVHAGGTGSVDPSPTMRFQNVGRSGAGSLKLTGSDPPSGAPEPSTLVIWSLLGAFGIAVNSWRRRRAA